MLKLIKKIHRNRIFPERVTWPGERWWWEKNGAIVLMHALVRSIPRFIFYNHTNNGIDSQRVGSGDVESGRNKAQNWQIFTGNPRERSNTVQTAIRCQAISLCYLFSVAFSVLLCPPLIFSCVFTFRYFGSCNVFRIFFTAGITFVVIASSSNNKGGQREAELKNIS